MRFQVSHHFPVSPRAYWDGTRDPALDAKILAAGDVDIDVLERTRDGAASRERVRVSPRRELPMLAQKALGAARFSYVQIVDGNDDTMTTTWKVVSDLIADKVMCSGTSKVLPTDTGCERIIEGEIKVAIPLVGGTIEKVVFEQIEKSYDRAADVIRRHLTGG
jgi:hypothetical protein